MLEFDCEGDRLIGILAEPKGPAADVGVIIIVGGPQYRAGSHRQFTLVARHLASHGFAALRFDYRGMGDSDGDARDFLGVDADIEAAITSMLAARPTLKRVVLWGLCDAASAALLCVESRHDPRICGLVLLNPWVRSAAGLARTHVKHYYWRRLREPEFWRKLLRGGVGLAALRGLTSDLRLAARASQPKPKVSRSFQDRMSAGLINSQSSTLLVLSGDDYTASEFRDQCLHSVAWQRCIETKCLKLIEFQEADHTFSAKPLAHNLNLAVTSWLIESF